MNALMQALLMIFLNDYVMDTYVFGERDVCLNTLVSLR